MSEKEIDTEEMKKELAFYRNQTKVLREKNRDLRNAMLLSDSKQGTTELEEEAQDTVSDIRKVIADSKKQLQEKLSQFKKDTIEAKPEKPSNAGSAPAPPNFATTMDEPKAEESPVSAAPTVTASTGDTDILSRQIEYLKEEIDRIETFLEQSEMVNNRLRDLLTEHNIDVSEITKAINEASKTAVSQKAVQQEEITPAKDEIKPTAVVATPTPEPKPEPKIKELDPTIAKLFDDFKKKLKSKIGEDDIKMEILNLREQLMDLIPHSRVFYEMQVEYRRWKRGISSIDNLKKAMQDWEKTIASM